MVEQAANAGSNILSSIIGGVFDYYQGKANREQMQKLHDEEMAMANKQFGWGQTMDRFNMGMTLKEAAAKATADQRATLMDAL